MLKFRWETEFKETEIGEIPKDWEIKKATEYADFIRGIEPGSKSYKNFGKYRFIRVGNLSGEREDEVFIDIEVDNEKIANKNDILISFDGTVGIVRKGLEGIFSSGIRKIKIKQEKMRELNYEFLYWFFKSTLKSQIFGFSDEKTTLAHASDSIPYLKIFLPPLSEQSRIATVLSCFDDLIEVKKRQNEILEKTAMAIFKNWFLDFEPFKNEEFVYNEELGREIPKGWEVNQIEKEFYLIKGRKCELSNDYFEGYRPYLLIETFRTGKIEFWTVEKKPQVDENDVVIVADGESSGKVLRYQKGILGSTLLTLKPKRGNFIELKHFIYLTLKSYEDEIMSHRTGSAIPHLDKDFLKSFLILLPPSPILQSFHSLVEPLFEKIILNQKQIMTLRKIRDALLPLLVFGKLRVEEI